MPKEINDYINYRKKIKNTEVLFIRSDYIFSREDFITDDYYLCEIILLLTALSKKAEIFMMKICDMNPEYQDFWTDIISKYIEMRSIRDDESIYQQTNNPAGLFKHLSKDKMSKVSSKKFFDVSYSMNKSNMIDFEEQKNLVINLRKKNNELSKEKNNLMNIIDKKEKEIKELQKIIATLNQKNQDIIKIKDDKILNLEKKTNEYESEIKNLKIILKENENKMINEKQMKDENMALKDKLMKLINENLVLKAFKEYKAKYESLIQKLGEENINSNYNLENLAETKEKLLAALKNNVNTQKENERLRKEIISLKDELKKEKEKNINIINNNGKEKENEIDYKLEYESLNIKAERYKYLLDYK